MFKRQKRKNEILQKRARRKPGAVILKIVRIMCWTCLFLAIVGVLSVYGLYMYISRELPKIQTLKDYKPPIITTVYSDDNRKIAEFFKERRVVAPLSEMPDMLKNAFIAAEDDRFYQHEGIDFISIVRAFVKNIEAGSIVQGGSTITQQVAKSFFLSPEKSYRRKMKEAILAYRIDKKFTKDEILFLYLNQIYLGHGAYGVEAAAENYFGKRVTELDLSECALLAGLPQAPSRYSPFKNPERARQRQIYVLNRMVAEGYITNMQATEALNRPLDIRPRKNLYVEQVPYYTEYVRQYVEKKYGRDALYNEGLKIYTAVNVDMQKAARAAVHKGLAELDKRQGYRGPLKHLEKEQVETYSERLQEKYSEGPLEKGMIAEGVVIEVDNRGKKVVVRIGDHRGVIALNNMKWARKPNPKVSHNAVSLKKPGDALTTGDVVLVALLEKNNETGLWTLSLEQEPKVQSALLCLEAGSGHVKTMIGGNDFRKSQFNRAIQSRRQPGSAFKPVVYAAALDKGYTPATVILDTAVVYEDKEQDFVWKPKNYSRKFYGPTLFRQALTHSRNLVTIKILKDIGVDYVIDYASKLGITSRLDRDLSLALGSSGMSLLEIVNAYAVFANGGYRTEPVFITKIVDRNGDIIEEEDAEKVKAIDKTTAYLITSILESVVKEGTGKRIMALNRPVAGKTGTTNDLYDAWFVGYTPGFVTGVWVGFDDEASLGKGETGSRAASPIWLEYMRDILKDEPVRVFEAPEGVEFVKIDAETGLLPIPESKKTYFEVFKEGSAPTEHTPRPNAFTGYDDFFKNGM